MRSFKKLETKKIVLENLISFISSYSENEDVQNAINDLSDLGTVFEETMVLNESETSVIKEGEGRISISGGGSYEMTEEAYDAIKGKALELRENFIK